MEERTEQVRSGEEGPVTRSAPRLPMKRLLENSRYLILVGVVTTLVASVAAFAWDTYKTVKLLVDLALGKEIAPSAAMIAIMDTFLIAAGLYIFSVAMYELFIGDLELPPWLVVHNIHQVKSLLSSIVILVLAIAYLEHVLQWGNPLWLLEAGVGIAAVIAALIAFNVFGEKKA